MFFIGLTPANIFALSKTSIFAGGYAILLIVCIFNITGDYTTCLRFLKNL